MQSIPKLQINTFCPEPSFQEELFGRMWRFGPLRCCDVPLFYKTYISYHLKKIFSY